MTHATDTPRDPPVPAAAAFDRQLWSQLEAMRLASQAASLTFTRRLARANGWSLAHARDVVAEHRRFLYLAARGGHPVTPSDAVDQAWHLYLVYTRTTGGLLCREVLGFELHHGPTLGGAHEQAKFADWYERTLASYRAHFGEAPPAGIWPSVADRFEGAGRMRRVDLGANWVVPRPSLRVAAALIGGALAGLVALLVGAGLLPEGGAGVAQAAVLADGPSAIVAVLAIVVSLGLLAFLTRDTGSLPGSAAVVALLGAASMAVPRGDALWTVAGAARSGIALALTLAAFALLAALYRTRENRRNRQKNRNAKDGGGGGASCGGDAGAGCGGCGGCGG